MINKTDKIDYYDYLSDNPDKKFNNLPRQENNSYEINFSSTELEQIGQLPPNFLKVIRNMSSIIKTKDEH